MKVLASGGGTGGHVIPTLAVLAELKRLQPDIDIIYVTQAGDSSLSLVKKQLSASRIAYIRAGKLRRFNQVSLWRQLVHIPNMLKNLRDLCRLAYGCWQSWRIIGRFKPDVVFIKGGFVGLPVGIAAHWRRVPIVTHDSDAVPGLTNRILSKWAVKCAVTMPADNYTNYSADKLIVTGLPIAKSFAAVRTTSKEQLRTELGLPINMPIVLVVPGSSGAKIINDTLVQTLPELLIKQKIAFVHVTGAKNFEAVKAAYANTDIRSEQLYIRPFVENLADYSRAADVIVTRAGSMLIELAAQKAAVVSVPNPYLTGGHQLKNAALYAKAKAVVTVSEDELTNNPYSLLKAIKTLLASSKERRRLGDSLYSFYKPDAAETIAELLLKVGAAQ